MSTRPAGPASSGPPSAPNSDATYQALRHVAVGSEAFQVVNATLARDAGTFSFASGTFYFLAPVNGKVTGAVFLGSGSFTLKPPTAMERKSLALLSGGDYKEDFDRAVFRFTDGTEAELRKVGVAGAPAAEAGDAQPALNESLDNLRTKLHYNMTARLLNDVLSPAAGGFFAAFIKGKNYSGHTLFVLDPHGALNVAPEEVELLTYDETRFGIWAAFHLAGEYPKHMANGSQKNALIDIDSQDLDTTIAKSARLEGTAKTTFFSGADGLRVAVFDLFPTLRVTSVTGPNGEPLPFIQEDKKDDPDFAVILPRPLAKNERYTIATTYGGKDAVSNEGSGNYYPVARSDWYPNTTFGDYADYHITFHTPKGMKIIGTGTPVRQVDEGGQTISEWKSEVPQAVAGFNLGAMKMEQAKLAAEGYTVEAWANESLPGTMGGASFAGDSGAVGTLSTIPMMKKALAEGQFSIQLYTDYFGPAPYKRVALTQQTACGYGQAWPALVYLPICSFFDDTQRHELFRGVVNESPLIAYFKVVAPHEVAHQWWGHTVGFNSYRDQWMSEGFAHFSASLFLQKYRNADYLKFWDEQHKQLLEKNRDGFRAVDVGPVVMGYRIENSRVDSLRTGVVYRALIYAKGAFILHMLRMMMWNHPAGDQTFKAMMHDFTATYANQAASTEDFKAMVEKHLPPELQLTTDGKLDWFFNEWVYGSAIPTYQLQQSFETGPNGDQVLNAKISQSNVDAGFLMPVAVYVEMNDGRLVRVAQAPLLGNTTQEFKIPLRGLKEKPKRALLNAYFDVLSSN